MKTIKRLPYMVALSLASLIGCKEEAPYVETNVSKYNGYDVMADLAPLLGHIDISLSYIL